MLEITIPSVELYDDDRGEFFRTVEKDTVLQLEHSLISLRKWESKWHVPFFSKKEHTDEAMIDYIRCMTLTRNIDPSIYKYIPRDEMQRIINYIQDPMTATWFSEEESKKTGVAPTVTAELIYYQMFSYNIPLECEKWHLNQLLTLIRVFQEKNNPKKVKKGKDLYRSNAKLNAARRKALGTRG